MSKDDVEQDLAQLRAEVAALSAVRKESAATPTASAPPSPVADATASPQTSVEPETGVAGAAEPEHSQLDELLELLEAEVKDLPTITCLIVFSLGILMGRFLR